MRLARRLAAAVALAAAGCMTGAQTFEQDLAYQRWKRCDTFSTIVLQRINLDGTSGFTASPWAYDNKVFCLSEDGDTFVIQAGPEYKLLRKNSLEEMCLATPAIAGDRLLIRTLSKLYCLRKTK